MLDTTTVAPSGAHGAAGTDTAPACPSCGHSSTGVLRPLEWFRVNLARHEPQSIPCGEWSSTAIDSVDVLDLECACIHVSHQVRVPAGNVRVDSPTGERQRGRPADATPQHWRRDVQGLRAIAVALVVLYHAGVPTLIGGYVGVDIFFVISGFVITQLLAREVQRTRRISIIRFYARRAQRIIPMAAIVLVVTVAASYHWLGFIRAGRTAVDAQWAAAFGANIRFADLGTDYLGAQLAPSPLQHYWSLSVEEQFYVVWPILLLLLARRGRAVVVGAVLAIIAASLAWSVLQTDSNGVVAYFSPLTRAFELMTGAAVALAAAQLERIRRGGAEILVLVGLTLSIGSAFRYDDTTTFPGIAVVVPVLGAAVLLAAGCSRSWLRVSAGRLLQLPGMTYLGNISFSLYLWHWPILTIAREYNGGPLTAAARFGLVVAALALSSITYNLVEDPVRRSRMLKARPALTIGTGILVIAGVFAFAITQLYIHPH